MIARISREESACGEYRCERPADRAVGVARGIVVSNATPGKSGLASVNPIFTWVRLAQRIPVRIQIDQLPPEIKLVVGMTASIEVKPGPQSSKRALERPPATSDSKP
jgi:multidrug resistance efflux pump